MTSYDTLPLKADIYSFYAPPLPVSFANIVESWSTEQVIQWLKGVDDSLSNYTDLFARRQIDGRSLLLLDNDALGKIGITNFGLCKVVLQAVELLTHYCYAVDKENLQSQCLCASVCARNLINDMRAVEARWPNATSRADIVAVHSAICVSVSSALEQLKRLLCWLDRSPFDRLNSYIDFRDEVMALTLLLSKAVCVSRKELHFAHLRIIEISNEIISKCEDVVRSSNDPLVLYTAYLERAVLRKGKSSDWGMNLQSSYRGIHVISEVKLHSPADACGKVDAGDELLQINGETVIGWKLSNVAKRIAFDGSEVPSSELLLLVKKRPREAVVAPLLMRSHARAGPLQATRLEANRAVLKIAPGSQQSTIVESHEQIAHIFDHKDLYLNGPLLRRSTSLSILSSHPIEACPVEKERARVNGREVHRARPPTAASSRRASVSCCTPPAEGRRHRDDVDLDDEIEAPSEHPITEQTCPPRKASIEHGRHHSAIEDISEIAVETVVRRRRTMRQQPGGYVHSIIDNCRLVCELDEEVEKSTICAPRVDDDEDVFLSGDLHPSDMPSCPEPEAYAIIEAIDNAELEMLDLPPIDLSEWRSSLDLSLPVIEEEPSGYAAFSAPPSASYETPGRISGFRTRNSDSASRSDGSWSKLPPGFGVQRMRHFFSSSFRSGSQAPIAESEESSLGWESDAGSESSFPQTRLSESYISSLEPDSVSSLREPAPNALRELSRINCAKLDCKQHEGWIRRKRLDSDVCPGGKWIKCWMALRSSVLFIYQNQLASEADIVIAVAKFMVSDAPDLKTSKKHVFRLYRYSSVFYFCAYSLKDMKIWMNKLGLATICYEQSEEERKNSDALSRSMLYISWLDDTPQSPGFLPSSSGHHTLPRANVSSAEMHNRAHPLRQNSLSSLRSAAQTGVTAATARELPPGKLLSRGSPHSLDERS